MPSVEDRCERVGECLIWQGAVSANGYGVLRHEGATVYAHRLAYIGHHGTIPEGLELDHLCGTPLCCEPSHLEAVTHAENMRRGRSSRLTPEQAREIRRTPGSVREVAKHYGVHNSTISRIRTGATWA